MKVLINELFNGKNKFEYTHQVEHYLGELLAQQFKTSYHPQTAGYNPKYDFLLGSTKIELKITKASNPSIEISDLEFNPTGLLLSESEYYLIISSGGSKGKFVGKIRMFKTEELKKLMICSLLSKKVKVFKPDSRGRGSISFVLDPKKAQTEKWIGDCELILDGRNVIGFDLNTILFSKNLAELIDLFA